MAGSFESNTNAYKNMYKYKALAPSNQLIDTTVFVVDFQERKFMHVGIDPTDKFKVMVHIITASRHVVISPVFLKRIFSQMGYILSIILDTPEKSTDNCICINDSNSIVTKMIHRGENLLAVESLTQAENRILLNRRDLMTIQYMERSIYENIIYKTQIIAPMVFKQFLEISKYLEFCFTTEGQKQLCVEEKVNFIKSVRDDHITGNIPKEMINFVSQIKSFAIEQLANTIFSSDTCITKVNKYIIKLT